MSRGPRFAARRTIGLLAALSGVALIATALMVDPAQAAQGPVDLGTASSFAVLAGSGITNTGPTTITGDAGTSPTASETGFGSVTLHGTDHGDDAVTQGAKTDLGTAYTDAAGRSPVTSVATELGGTKLGPGVYGSPTFGLTGTLTLDAGGDANAQFIFQSAATVISARDSQVVLKGGAQACNVVWQVGSSATFGTDTQFVGNVLAQTSITAQTGAVFNGRLLAENGAVTLDTNTITAATCAANTSPTSTPTPTPTTSQPTPTPTISQPTPTPTISQPTPTPTTSRPTTSPTPSSATSHLSPGHHTQAASVAARAGDGRRASPRLPVTGAPTLLLTLAGLACLALGAAALRSGRR